MSEITRHSDYRQALADIKLRIQAAQVRAVFAVNSELLGLYWDIGRRLLQWQSEQGWGAAVVEQMASDLHATYPEMKGFSRSSLFAMRQMVAFFSPQFEFVPQPVGQMPWGHVRTLLTKVKSVDTALLYAQNCIENGWSRSVLEWQIEQRFHERAGKATGNFTKTLPAPQSELVQQSLKDPYVFDFLTLTPQAVERDIENQLMAQITRFLLELGKAPDDQPTIGLILCKDKDKLDVEYALRDINKPMGVSSFIGKDIPLSVQSQLPSVEDIEIELAAQVRHDNGAAE
ncbi:PDDEXK nuclease domain-containing protein [Rhodoferax ferrireducens]|uniref:PDDEXK nuclease domain-containing protein n=1 Tax=Rhodoferax ferrireducens TaxID=192843 RepID=UPI000E0DE7CD|nr:PDDEXK nuclease domain-containing protein [Rhodoferax ferrireducens]